MSKLGISLQEVPMSILRIIEEKFELYLSIFLLCAMTIVMAIQVFMRYVVQHSLSWSEELARYIFVWLVFIAISYGAKNMKHIRIEAALGLFPPKLRPYIVIFSDVLFLLFAAFICYTAYGVVLRQIKLGAQSPAIMMPMWILYAAPMVGFFLSGIREIQTIVMRIRALKKEG
ncbi:TRAP transporter small permease [uncultured Cohaesibacter sp.]|uniref:TRAP transporter small permease n=1 Tax=uncultured Cohaesibacter sp. TaxID=1002546 RepID=UPI00292DD8DE|nr:TRAP transporter small permease [uncultured Cohaesibacter sp.]